MNIYTTFPRAFFILILLTGSIAGYGQPNCSDPGIILTGSSSTLDKNSDGYFSKYNNTGYTVSSNEVYEFEFLAGAGGADVNWTSLGGTDPQNDLQAGGGCGNTDIVTDADGGSDHAYYTIVDPDGSADNGDEYIAFALRIADESSGKFGFSFLLDSDNNCSGVDLNDVCGNPCFEYEIQLVTGNSGGEVEVYNIDGCTGTADCDLAAGGDATVCAPCNTEGIQVCAGGSDCGAGAVFWVFYVNFSQLPGVLSTSSFSLTPATTTSGNQVIYKGTNVSDYGSLDDNNDILAGSCDCATICAGSGCSDCIQDCALACAADENIINTPLPVNWLGIDSKIKNGQVWINWMVTAEEGVSNYIVERKREGNFEAIGETLATPGNHRKTYQFVDADAWHGTEIYRVKQVDWDGKYSYSASIALSQAPEASEFFLDENQRLILRPSTLAPVQELSLFNMAGQLMHQASITSQTGQMTVDLDHLPKGVYLVSLQAGTEGRMQKKIFLR